MFIWSLSNQTWQQPVNISSAIHEDTQIRLNNYLLGNVAYWMHTPKKTINCSWNGLQCWDRISCNNIISSILRLTLVQLLWQYTQYTCISVTKCTTVIITNAALFTFNYPITQSILSREKFTCTIVCSKLLYYYCLYRNSMCRCASFIDNNIMLYWCIH